MDKDTLATVVAALTLGLAALVLLLYSAMEQPKFEFIGWTGHVAMFRNVGATARNVLVTWRVSSFPGGSWYESRTIGDVNKGERFTVDMLYEPDDLTVIVNWDGGEQKLMLGQPTS